jgi:nicotinate (nicotinamide) nucleotide adenylyltransferase
MYDNNNTRWSNKKMIKKVGLYGGSFNPVHNGHVLVAESVLESKLVDELWIVPCKNHAFGKTLAPVKDRLAMLEYAFNGIDSIRIDLTEINSEKTNYTSETLKIFKDKSKGIHSFYIVAGIDAFNDLEKWHDFKYIKENAGFIGIYRPGYNINPIVKNIMSHTLPIVSDVSSTKIRERVANGKSIDLLVNEKVGQYIIDNNLYLENGKYKNPASTVDLIVPYDKGIVLIERKDSPFKGYWALPGGYLENGKESLEEAAVRELKEETHLIASPESLELIGVYSDPKRDPRGHVISHAFKVNDYSGEIFADSDAVRFDIFSTLPEKLAFDHAKIIADYYKSIRNEKN